MEYIILVLQVLILIIFPIWIYLWCNKFVKKRILTSSGVDQTDLHFALKRWWAMWCIAKRKKAEKTRLYKSAEKTGFVNYIKPHLENSIMLKDENSCDSILFYASDQAGNSVYVKLTRKIYRIMELSLQVLLSNGRLYVLPDFPNTVVLNNTSHGWSAKGLHIELLEPQQRWRITYNGMLRKKLETNINDADITMQHICLNFIFIAGPLALEWPGDWSTYLHADALAREPWRSPQWINKMKLMDYAGFDQWGSIVGQIQIDSVDCVDLYLRGLCQRRWGTHESHQFEQNLTLFGITSKGTMYCLGASILKNGTTQVQFGHIKEADESVYEIDTTDLDLSKLACKAESIHIQHNIKFTAAGREYMDVIDYRQETPSVVYSGQPWNWAYYIYNIKIDLNGSKGVGLMLLECPYNGPFQIKTPLTRIHSLPSTDTHVKADELILFYDDEKCQNESWVGGKASSLAALTVLNNGEYIVPRGFCITAHAFDLQLQHHAKLRGIIYDIEEIIRGKEDGNLKESCEKAVLSIQCTPMLQPIEEAIYNAMSVLKSQEVVDESIYNNRLAVRSSAIGEDSEHTSAAGQNTTYLGIKDESDIIKKVTMCWASLFSYQSVEYRRQNILPVMTSMGVCVQQMVNAEAAGVMFTRHPTTGNPSEIVITANYGLGESVVSAAVEPDTLLIHRNYDDNLSIKSSTVGHKTHRTCLNSDGVATTTIDPTESRNICISEEVAIRLAKVGLYLEYQFGNARDIEWAIVAHKIYLLQARPITTINAWTDFEISHELDSGVPNESDIMLFSNVGEVLPNSISPLTISSVVRILNRASCLGYNGIDRVGLHIVNMRCCMNYFSLLLQFVGENITMSNKMADIALSGHIIITPAIFTIAKERNGVVNFRTSCKILCATIKDAWQNESNEKKAKLMHNNFSLNVAEFCTAHSLYNEIEAKFHNIFEMTLYHAHASRVSITYQMLALSTVSAGSQDLLPEHFADIAIISSSCSNVVSCEVPILLHEIALCIKTSGNGEQFSKINPVNGIDWLQSNCPTAAKKLETLLKLHGHRCIQELDLFSEPWSLKPETLIIILQKLAMSVEECNTTKTSSTEDIIRSLKTPNTGFSKWWLKQIIPRCRAAVRRREVTKSLLVSVVHKFKIAYRQLAALMVIECYLPDKELVFFLTHYEIGQLLRNRSLALIRKANRRRRIFLQLGKLQYPEVNSGMPMPIKVTVDASSRNTCTKIQGTAVYGGSVLGRACVIRDLSEAEYIKHGDILITHSTDIGWSPYFPLLGGIVTELGGLISHGAVVAREYGLPCVVGAVGATKVFKTGDTVLLAADMGALELVEKHTDEMSNIASE